jgi:NTE family protein
MSVPGADAVTIDADLVLEGGGVKGIALAGAVDVLWKAGYRFRRIAGSSAGAIAGAVLAALGKAGEPLSRLEEVARTLDYARFRDRGPVGRALGPLGFLLDGVSVLTEGGVYEGDYLRDWVAGVLSDLGVRTFGDLRTDDPGGDGRIHHRYRLVVTASDVSRRRLAQLPWDYHEYGLDPDDQPVADAVRASASIPYFFEPVELRGPHGTATLVDGGLVSNYPISIFDRLDELPPRWPTIGVRLHAPQTGDGAPEPTVEPVRGPVAMGVALVETAIEACQAEHLLRPCNIARSVFVRTAGVRALGFDVTEAQKRALLAAGRVAAEAFLLRWDFDEWKRTCRPT